MVDSLSFDKISDQLDQRVVLELAPTGSETVPIKTSILNGQGFLLQNFFSPSECLHYIDQAEKLGLEHVTKTGSKVEYRDCVRVLAFSEPLAQLIYERLRSHLGNITIDDSNIDQYGIGKEGVWECYGVNNVFRLVRYDPAGHFSPHFDGEYMKSPSDRSLKTIMIYLNGDFEGGATNFLKNDIAPEAMRGSPEDIILSVQPEEGLAIVFDHFIMHEGQELKTNKKYIFRTEAMYRKIADVQLNISPQEREGRRLLILATQAETRQEYDLAVSLYRKAFKLCPSLEKLDTLY